MEKAKHEDILEILNWRYAVKKFDPTQKIAEKDWQVLEESLRLSPSSYGLQPWDFVVVQSPELRKKLTPVSWNQQQIEACSHLVVLTRLNKVTEEYVDRYIRRIAEVRGIPESTLHGFRGVMMSKVVKGLPEVETPHWTARQAYIAMGGFMTAAAMLQVDTCPIEGIEPEKYDEILGLTNTLYSTVAVLAAGYRAADDPLRTAKKVRFEKKDVIHYR